MSSRIETTIRAFYAVTGATLRGDVVVDARHLNADTVGELVGWIDGPVKQHMERGATLKILWFTG